MKEIKFRALKNFRDLGGAKLANGEILPFNKFFRSPSLYKLHKKDIAALVEKHHIKTIIDLRTKQEASEKPDTVIEGVKYYHIPIFDESKVGITRDRKSMTLGTLRDMPKMKSLYETMASEECLPNVDKVVDLILNLKDDELPVIFHCTAGKDRTGVVAALLLRHFGASDETIYEDYMYTNKGRVFTGYIKAILIAIIGLSISLGIKVKGFVVADKKCLEAFLKAIPSNHRYKAARTN